MQRKALLLTLLNEHKGSYARRASLFEHIGNSPDMNAIEGAWTWRGEWDRLSQEKIRAMVARQAAINTLIIEHEGEMNSMVEHDFVY